MICPACTKAMTYRNDTLAGPRFECDWCGESVYLKENVTRI